MKSNLKITFLQQAPVVIKLVVNGALVKRTDNQGVHKSEKQHKLQV